MPRFTLNLFNGQDWLPGAEAQDFADCDAAYACAICTIRDLVSSEVREGARINLTHYISIRDQAGRELQGVLSRLGQLYRSG